MRIPALAILTAAALFTAAPAGAQTYDPNYPVCLQTYSIGGGHIECSYSTLAQCNVSASGRGGQCLTNPFFAGAEAPADPRYRRQRGFY